MTTSQFQSWLRTEIKYLARLLAQTPEEIYSYEAVGTIKAARQIALSLGLIEVAKICERIKTPALEPLSAQKVLAECLSKLKQAPESLTPPEVAKILKVNPGKVLTWIRSGALKATNVSQSNRPRYRITLEEIELFKRGRQVNPKPKQVRKASPYRGKIYV
jgi:hypothetical protein